MLHQESTVQATIPTVYRKAKATKQRYPMDKLSNFAENGFAFDFCSVWRKCVTQRVVGLSASAVLCRERDCSHGVAPSGASVNWSRRSRCLRWIGHQHNLCMGGAQRFNDRQSVATQKQYTSCAEYERKINEQCSQESGGIPWCHESLAEGG